MKLIIDSQKRDKTLYPNSNSFVYKTTRLYSNISRAYTSTIQMLTSDYVINSNNNIFQIILATVTYNNTLTRGTWSAANYATQLQTDLNNVGNWNVNPGLTWTVTFNSNTMKYTISAGSSFIINFNVKYKLAQKLGFANSQTVSATSHTSSSVVQFFNSRYYDFRIAGLMRDSSENLGNCFARLYNNSNPFEIIDYQDHRDYKSIKSSMDNTKLFPQELKIEMYDEFGDLVDNNNTDFILVITME